ncbi:MAG: hypothetical protein K2O18_05080 [Oscillospiraceae bacterium]|nr:hypothetical protein [Oscillospiraceae bacterium]
MGNFFSDPVEQALEYIYYNERAGRGREGVELLGKADLQGDGDADCILARCLCGSEYVWSGHGFPVKKKEATKMLRRSVERGSQIGVLVALHNGELSLEQTPISSLQDAFAIVLEKAEGGDAFCQYMIGNVYFERDFLQIEGKNEDSFDIPVEYKDYLRENISKCEEWFQRAFEGGMHLAANNLNRFYLQGDGDIILPQPEKAQELWKTGAERGYPCHQYIYAQELAKAGQKEEAFEWFKQAAEGGEPYAWYEVGRVYLEGDGVEQDAAYACQCFEKELPWRHVASYNLLGKAYFEGDGVEQDYEKAFRLLQFAYEESNKGNRKNNWGVYFLGKCYFEGWGTEQDYVKARQFLEQMDWEYEDAYYMLGVIYARGRGVQEDIKKGVTLLQKAGTHLGAQEELLRYRKTLFGRWVRR